MQQEQQQLEQLVGLLESNAVSLAPFSHLLGGVVPSSSTAGPHQLEALLAQLLGSTAGTPRQLGASWAASMLRSLLGMPQPVSSAAMPEHLERKQRMVSTVASGFGTAAAPLGGLGAPGAPTAVPPHSRATCMKPACPLCAYEARLEQQLAVLAQLRAPGI